MQIRAFAACMRRLAEDKYRPEQIFKLPTAFPPEIDLGMGDLLAKNVTIFSSTTAIIGRSLATLCRQPQLLGAAMHGHLTLQGALVRLVRVRAFRSLMLGFRGSRVWPAEFGPYQAHLHLHVVELLAFLHQFDVVAHHP